MPFSHHSHSGQFCPGHASNSLEEIVQTAIAKSVETYALTEHMPRHDQDRYPEEIEMGWDLAKAQENHTAFFQEAIRLREHYQSQIRILIGFESEWIRPSSLDLLNICLQSNSWDFFVGSVHHVHTKPIDFDPGNYQAARKIAGGTDQQLFADYFDSQLSMLQAARPPVVGHFDLIRLQSENPEWDIREWQPVWELILRNLEFISSYGGLLEVNFASLRKGLTQPYPKDEIAQAFERMGGRFCLSDDSHGVGQVALNYSQCIAYLQRNHINCIYFLERALGKLEAPFDSRFPCVGLQSLKLEELRRLPFWRNPG